MAMTGGTAKLVHTGKNGATGSAIKVYVYYKTTQDVSANKSTISLGLYFTQVSGNGSIGPWVKSSDSYLGLKTNTFDGAIPNVSSSNSPYWVKENVTMSVNHNADGTGSATIYWKWGVNSAWAAIQNPSGSFTITLPTIPRQATLTAAPDFNDENNPTITYSNPAGNSITALDACISFDGSADNIGYRAVSKTGTSYTFSLTEAERNVLRNGTSGNSRTVKFYLRTKIGDSTYYSSLSKTLTLVNHTPTLSPSAYVSTSSTTYSLTGSQTTFIKGYTDITVSTGAAARKGASLTSQKIVNGNVTVNSGSGTIKANSNGTFTFYATDSRGNTSSSTLTRTIINYVTLTCNMKPRITVDGTATVSISGNVFNGSFGAVQNTLAIEARYRVAGGTWSSWVGVNGSKSGNTYSATKTYTGLDYRTRYGFQVRVTDKLGTVTTSEVVTVALPVFDWGEDSFNFNVPVNFAAGYTQSASLIDTGVEISDFIVEAGTSGIWSYRKWNSGFAECWGRKTVNVAVNVAWGSLYVSGYLGDSMVDLPFTFKEVPMINANLSANGAGGFLIASGSVPATTTSTGGYEIARGTVGAANNYVINYDVRGRWK